MEQRIAHMQELVRFVREVRNRYQLDSKVVLDVAVRCDEDSAADFHMLAPFITSLAGVGRLDAGPQQQKPHQSISHIMPGFEAYVSLQGLIDIEQEVKRLDKLLTEKKRHLQSAEAKLNNSSFVDKAPAEVVQQQKDLVVNLKEQIQVIETNLRELRPH